MVSMRHEGITGRRVIDYLKDKNHWTSLERLRHAGGKRRLSYSLWQHENNVFSIFSEVAFMQKVNYVQLNPVRAGLDGRAIDYR